MVTLGFGGLIWVGIWKTYGRGRVGPTGRGGDPSSSGSLFQASVWRVVPIGLGLVFAPARCA
jgi:hypothetical protein